MLGSSAFGHIVWIAQVVGQSAEDSQVFGGLRQGAHAVLRILQKGTPEP